jgi:hypothetical protein
MPSLKCELVRSADCAESASTTSAGEIGGGDDSPFQYVSRFERYHFGDIRHTNLFDYTDRRICMDDLATDKRRREVALTTN